MRLIVSLWSQNALQKVATTVTCHSPFSTNGFVDVCAHFHSIILGIVVVIVVVRAVSRLEYTDCLIYDKSFIKI